MHGKNITAPFGKDILNSNLSYKKMPKLSVITINLNNKRGLDKTLKSVTNQTFADYEYIIIDGGSTDGSIEIINRFQNKLSYWVSEPDKGIYNAMNKGIMSAKGDYCLFLNSGDTLINNKTLEKLFEYNYTEDILFGDMYFNKTLQKYPDHISFRYLINRSLGHGSTIIKRNLFIQYGCFDENLKIVADWEFFMRCIIMKSCNYRHLNNFPISRFKLDGISSNPKFSEKHYAEKILVFKKILPELSRNDNRIADLSEAMLRLSIYENSKLAHVALAIENSRFFHFLKKLYHYF
jgi:glycosyltransferase involved in cell wall biosynthesis